MSQLYVLKGLAVARAIDAVAKVLPLHLPAKLEEFEDLEPGIRLPEPTQYHLALGPEGPRAGTSNSHVACWIYQAGPSREMSQISGDPNYAITKQRTYIEVVIAYDVQSAVAYTPVGWPQPLDNLGVIARRGYYYIGATMDVIHKHLCCESGGAIVNVVGVSNDLAGALVADDGQQIRGGYASCTFELEQHVLVPYCDE